jgi:HAMP domain-containing protein
MRLRIKILSGFFILATMLACAGLLSIYELLSIGASVNRLLSDNYKSINAAKTMIEALEREDSGVLLVLSGKWENGRETIESGDLAFQKALWMEPLAGTKKEHNLDWYFEEIHGAFQTAKQSVEELMVLNDETMYLTASSLRNRANRAVMPGIVAIVSSLVFVLIFDYFINYFVIKPINILAQEAKNSIRTREPLKIDIETKDELRDLASAIQELASSRQRQP